MSHTTMVEEEWKSQICGFSEAWRSSELATPTQSVEYAVDVSFVPSLQVSDCFD